MCKIKETTDLLLYEAVVAANSPTVIEPVNITTNLVDPLYNNPAIMFIGTNGMGFVDPMLIMFS